MTKKEKKIYDMQSPQTKRMMDMQARRLPNEDKEWASRPPPETKDSQVTKADGSIDLSVREISEKEYSDYVNLRIKRGAWIEEVRTQYLLKMAAEGKIHHSLMNQIETNHVMPPDRIKERAAEKFMWNWSMKSIADKFKEIMRDMFKPSHAEIVAEGMRRMNSDK